MKIRSFLAFDISNEMRRELASIIGLLSPKVKDAKWVRPELMHCTMRFFGEIEEELLFGKLSDVVGEILRHQAPLKLAGRGLGVFPNWRYPKVIWAGLVGDTDAVMSLHSRLEDAFSEIGLKKDPRALRLHLTLARMKSAPKDTDQLTHLVEKLGDRDYGKISVDKFVLYKSELTRDGSIYTPLKTFTFGDN